MTPSSSNADSSAAGAFPAARGPWRWQGQALAGLPVYAAFLLLVGLPLLTVLGQSVMPALFDPRHPDAAFDPSPLLRAVGTPRIAISILHSLELGAVVALAATALGATFAIMTARFALPFRRLIAPVPWFVFLMPSYLKALAWVLLMSPGGYLAQLGLVGPGLTHGFFSLGGLVFVHTLGLFPLPAFITGAALAGIGPELEDAARLAGLPRWRIWAGVMLPLLAPALALSLIATFAEVLSDFGLAATIAHQSHFGLLTYGIYIAASDYPTDFPMAGAQALILLTMILIVVFADRALRRQSEARLISGRSRAAPAPEAGGAWRWPVAAVALAIAGLALWLPLAAIIARAATATLGGGLAVANLTFGNLSDTLDRGAPANAALLRSLGYAGLSAGVAAGTALILAARIDRAGRSLRAAVLGLSLGAVAIPGIVLAFGYILVWNRLPLFQNWPFPHYGQGSLLVTGYVAAALPYCLIVILSAIQQLSPSLTEAARLHGHGPAARLVRIVLPLVLLAVLTAFLLTFIRTIFELPISQLLIPVTGSPVPPFVVKLFNHDEDGLAAALSLVSMAVAGGAAGLIWLALRPRLTFGTRGRVA